MITVAIILTLLLILAVLRAHVNASAALAEHARGYLSKYGKELYRYDHLYDQIKRMERLKRIPVTAEASATRHMLRSLSEHLGMVHGNAVERIKRDLHSRILDEILDHPEWFTDTETDDPITCYTNIRSTLYLHIQEPEPTPYHPILTNEPSPDCTVRTNDPIARYRP